MKKGLTFKKAKQTKPEFITIGDVVLRRSKVIALIPGQSNGAEGTWAIVEGYSKMLWISDDIPYNLL